MWDLRTRTARPAAQLPISPFHLAYSDDGSLLAAATHCDVVVWDVAANAPVWSFQEWHTEPVAGCCGIRGLFWSGARLVTIGVDGVVRLWDVGTKKQAVGFPLGAGGSALGTPTAGGGFLLLYWLLVQPAY